MPVYRTQVILTPDQGRVVFRPFVIRDEQRIERIMARVMTLSDARVDAELAQVRAEFGDRHPRLFDFFCTRFEHVKSYVPFDEPLSANRQLLIGAYFSQEYSLESAALFNPSMVWHPDQRGLPKHARRFVLSLRATGEGHISSICFRSGTVYADGRITLEAAAPCVTTPDIVPNAAFEKLLFQRKLFELGLENDFTRRVLECLNESFTMAELEVCLELVQQEDRSQRRPGDASAGAILTLAQSNYQVAFAPELSMSERVIMPVSPAESNGIEDARFVRFIEEDGKVHYYATYTAYDGEVIIPQLLETDDFLHFNIGTLNGPAVRNKGMALFPRRVNGHYAMISRQDNENIFLMYSDMLHFWYTKKLIVRPRFPWEFVQLGNCGAPIETEAGWLVLSHGVGPMRKYSMGAFLLDRNDPSKLIGRLAEPLLSPNENEREGYVPNVVYSCGGALLNNTLIIPYAMSDYASTFATIGLEELLGMMV